MTTRRGFIQGILALGVAPVLDISIPVKTVAHPPYGLPPGLSEYNIGASAGMAKALAESMQCTIDEIAYKILSAEGIYAKVIRPSMDLVWADAYSNMVPVTWEEFYKSS